MGPNFARSSQNITSSDCYNNLLQCTRVICTFFYAFPVHLPLSNLGTITAHFLRSPKTNMLINHRILLERSWKGFFFF